MSRPISVCFTLAAGMLCAPRAGAEPGSGSSSGTVRLPSGLTARYQYHFDRNALHDCRRAGDALIALTDSGNLLRLDLATLELTREWFGPAPVTCLGRGENASVLAGFQDGRICRIDPATLAPPWPPIRATLMASSPRSTVAAWSSCRSLRAEAGSCRSASTPAPLRHARRHSLYC